MGHLGVGDGSPPLNTRTKAISRPFIEGSVAHDVVRHSTADRQRGLLNGGARRSAAVVDPAEERQITDPECSGDVDIRVRLRRIGHHAADLVWGDAGVSDRRLHRLGGEPELRATGGLRELGGADPDDGHLTGKCVCGHQTSPRGNETSTVPTT